MKRRAAAEANDEEEAFPRGRTGGDRGTARPPAEVAAEHDDGDEPLLDTNTKGRGKGKKGRKGEDEEDAEPLPQEIKHINRLRLIDVVEGTVLIGAVRDANEEELTLNLPYNLLGFCARAQALEVAEASEVGRASLPDLYPPGTVVVAVVIAVVELNGKTQRIEVSLRPALANAGLTAESLQQHMWLPAVVQDAEEHVLKLNFGVEKLVGLLKKSELSHLGGLPQAGTILMVAVQAVNAASGTVRCSLTSSEPIGPEPIEQVQLKAGLLVSARVKKVIYSDDAVAGLVTNFNGAITAILHVHHQGSAVDGIPEFKRNQRVTARILAVVPPVQIGSPATVHLTLLPHLLDWTAQAKSLMQLASIGDRLEGEVLDYKPKFGCKLLCERTQKDQTLGRLPGFCAGPRLCAKDSDPPPSSVAAGFKTEYRVLAYNFLDGLVMLTRRPADLEEGVRVSIAELSPGEYVIGTVNRVADHGIFVELSDYVTGHVHLRQLTDVPLASVSKRFVVGSKVKCRVLHADAGKRTLSLTAKKSLVKDDFQLIDNANAKTNMLVTGYVSSIKTYGAIVSFFGGAFGLIPQKAMEIEEAPALGMAVRCRVDFVDKKKQRLILSLDLEKGCKASELLGKAEAAKAAKGTSAGTDALIGSVATEVRAVRCSKDGVVVRFTAANSSKTLLGYVPTAHLSDDLVLGTARHASLASALGGIVELSAAGPPSSEGDDEEGTAFPEKAVVLAKIYHPGRVGKASEGDAGTDSPGFVLLSLKPSMCLSAQESCFVNSLADIKVGRLYAGYIKEVKEFGAIVCIGSFRLGGLVQRHQVSSKFVEKPSDELSAGQSVRVLVGDVDEEKQRFSGDLRPSAASAADAPLLAREAVALRTLLEQREALATTSLGSKAAKKRFSLLAPGSVLDAVVTEVKNFGLLLSLPFREGLTAVCLKENMPESFRTQAGASIKCAVLDFDPESGIADVSLQPELLGVASTSSSVASGGQKRKKKDSDDSQAQPAVLHVGLQISVLPALQKQTYSVLWCKDPPCVVFAPPFGSKSWAEPRPTTVQSVPDADSCGEAARVVVLCPQGSREKKEGKVKVPRILRPEEELQVGSPIKMRIRAIHGLQVFCTAPVGLRGHVHASQFLDLGAVGSGGESPLEGMRKTGVIEARVLRMQQRAAGVEDTESHGGKVWHLELTCRPKLMEPQDASEYESEVVRWSSLKPGRLIAAAVLSVQKNMLWFEVAPGIKGRVSMLDASAVQSVVRSLAENFHVGQVFQTRVLRTVSSQKELDLSLLPEVAENGGKQNKGKPQVILAKLQKVEEKVGGKGMVASFRLPERKRATAHITELFDVWAKQPLKRLKVGTIYEVVLLRDWNEDAPGLEGRAEVSLRPSLVHGQKESEEEKRPLSTKDLMVGQKVSGYVINSGPAGVFVGLSRSLVARIKLKSISDRPVLKEAVAQLHPSGSLIRDAMVVEVDHEKGLVELSLRSGQGPGSISVEQLSVGDVVSGRVKAVQAFGIFVRLDNSNVDALVHKTEVSDSASISMDSYQVGAKIAKAKVLKIDGKRVSLSLKASSFELDELEEDDEDDDEDEDEDLTLAPPPEKSKPDAKRKREEAEKADAEEDAEQEEEEASKAAKKAKKVAAVIDSDDEEPWKRKSGLAGTSDGTGFDFADFKVDDPSSSDEEAGGDEDEEGETKKPSKRQKKAKKLAEEKDLQQREAENADGQWADDPKSTEDFERLLLTQGDTSIVWIRYMAFHLKMSDLVKARQVAERAVKHVGFSEGKERFNAWVAYMNLECTFGTDETADAIFKRAASHNDAKQVHLQLARIHERNKKPQFATKAFEAVCRKFPHSKKVWLAFITFLYQQGDMEGGRKTLPKCLAALPRRKHPVVVSKAALLEYQEGSAERGRSVFEGLLDSYPKRTDLWSVYIDAHMKAFTPPKVVEPDFKEVRGLLERCCAMKLKATKMRFFFKRFLDFEKRWGNAESQEHVREKARQFVEDQAA